MEALEKETIAFMGIMGAARSQGADVEIPTVHEARQHFDDWLLDDSDDAVSHDKMLMRALGLGGGG